MSSNDNITVIIGAGIIGCATAYYLSRKDSQTDPQSIHIIEISTELFSSASGKAGGFLAEDWFAHEVSSLGALSFRLHRELAEEFNGYHRWGYCRSTGNSFVRSVGSNGSRGEDWLRSGGSRASTAAAGVHESASAENSKASEPTWLMRHSGDRMDIIGEEGGVAQVDPLRLSRFLLDKSIEAGVTLHQPVEAIRLVPKCDENKVNMLILRQSSKSSCNDDNANATTYTIPCTRLLLASGAWTPSVFRTLFPDSTFKIQISPLAGHSIVVRSPYLQTASAKRPFCHAIFTTSHESSFSPEIFSRVGDEIYIAGLNSASIPLPTTPEDAHIDETSITKLINVAKELIKSRNATNNEYAMCEDDEALVAAAEGDIVVLREGLCFRPVTRTGLPIVAKVMDAMLGQEDSEGGEAGMIKVFVAAGHGPWGISQSLGTGLVMAEMLEGKTKTSADVGHLRF